MMKTVMGIVLTLTGLLPCHVTGQSIELKSDQLEAIGVARSVQNLDGKQTVAVVKDTSVKADDEPTFVRLRGIGFKNGTIEVNVLSKLRPALHLMQEDSSAWRFGSTPAIQDLNAFIFARQMAGPMIRSEGIIQFNISRIRIISLTG